MNIIKDMQDRLEYLEKEMDLKSYLSQKYQEVGGLRMNDISCVLEIIYNVVMNGRI